MLIHLLVQILHLSRKLGLFFIFVSSQFIPVYTFPSFLNFHLSRILSGCLVLVSSLVLLLDFLVRLSGLSQVPRLQFFHVLAQACATTSGITSLSVGVYPVRSESLGKLVLEIHISSECVRTGFLSRLLIGHFEADFPQDRKKSLRRASPPVRS